MANPYRDKDGKVTTKEKAVYKLVDGEKVPIKTLPPPDLQAQVAPQEEPLPPDLQAPVSAVEKTPQERAKMVRQAFGSRGWPNEEHRGTVRDFLVEHNIPIAEPIRS